MNRAAFITWEPSRRWKIRCAPSPDEVIADRRLAERNPFRRWSSLSVSESFIRNNCHSTHNCGCERPGVLTSSIRADTRNGGQRSAWASRMRVRNTGPAVASAQPTVSPARISWVKSSASRYCDRGIHTPFSAVSSSGMGRAEPAFWSARGERYLRPITSALCGKEQWPVTPPLAVLAQYEARRAITNKRRASVTSIQRPPRRPSAPVPHRTRWSQR